MEHHPSMQRTGFMGPPGSISGDKNSVDTGRISPRRENSGSTPIAVSTSIADTRNIVLSVREQGLSVGLVPTMGFFHEGHLSLMRAARSECGYVAVSVFVNPTQFAPGEDLDAYPRDLDRDIMLAAREDVDLMFVPAKEEMYPVGHSTVVEVGEVSAGLCGSRRPDHFCGVATIVAKLFGIVRPDTAYFGQKDAQQAAVIRRMSRDLDFDIAIRVLPTVREEDGLAMSSRNAYLTQAEREQAVVLYQALAAAREAVDRGESEADSVREIMSRIISGKQLVEMEYAEVVDPDTLQPLTERIAGPALGAVAVKVGSARLIDNMMLSE